MPVQESSWFHHQALTPSSAMIDPSLLGNGNLGSLLTSPLAGRSVKRPVNSLPPSSVKSISLSGIPIFGPNDMPNLFAGMSMMLPVEQ